jgi:DNA-binding MarR family transcriptional regulator
MQRRRSLLTPKKRGRPPKNEKVREELPVKPLTPELPALTSKSEPKSESGLNERQELYLKAIYAEDQAAERHEAWRWNHGYGKRPADEWRWLLYADLAGGATPLKRLLKREGMVDAGTGSTFIALERRGLINHRERYESHIASIERLTSVRLTRKGRAEARKLLGESAPKKLPKGTLREWHWNALTRLYEAGGELSSELHVSGCYGGISWKTWLRLRDYFDTGMGLVKEHSRFVRVEWNPEPKRVSVIQLTEAGRKFYYENWEKYRNLYPDVEAPSPDPKLKT